VLLNLARGAVAQDSEVADSTADSTHVVDTVLYNPGNIFDNAAPVTAGTNFEKHLTQNPTIGMFKSMAVPGWGQVGNRDWIKAAVFFGLDAWFVASAIHYKGKASDLYDLYEGTPHTNNVLRGEYYDRYQQQKDQRNKFTWFAVFTTLASMLDAYVDAHLSGYPSKKAEDGVSLSLEPGLVVESAGAKFSIRF